MSRLPRAIWIGFLALGLCGPAAAAERVALVIGNDSYQRAPALRNARNDARAMAALLGNLGFRLVGEQALLDVKQREFARLVRDFGNEIGPGDVALFYFAGHGIAGIAQQTNWLIPVDDGAIEIQEDVPDFSVGLHSVLRRMEARGEGINLVFLDACRNNPLPNRARSAGGTRGLARIDAPIGSFIAYAAAPGEAALDGDGANGLFTGALIDAMKTPGLRIEDMLIRTTQAVREASAGRQVPWRESSLEQAFYLVPPESAPPTAPAVDSWAAEVAFWTSIQASDDPRVFEAYLKRYPTGIYSDLARIRLETLAGEGETQVAVGSYPPDKKLAPEDHFKDCEDCPEMVVVPAGSYMMGLREAAFFEGPEHRVTIPQPFAVGVHEVTRGQWLAFATDSGHKTEAACYTFEAEEWETRFGRSWRDPGFDQADNHPVVCISWEDAQAHVSWLSRTTGQRYRLLSESEWEYVARAGTQTARYWGDGEAEQCRHANGADLSSGLWLTSSCDDGYKRTSPVGSYPSNDFGLYDILGNAWKWVEDCFNPSYAGAPSDGAAWNQGNCSLRVFRSGSWKDDSGNLQSAIRAGLSPREQTSSRGLRVARSL